MSMMLTQERQRRVLGIASTGFPIYAISGSEGENEGNSGEGENKQGEGDGKTGDTGSTGGTGTSDPPQPRVFSQEEYDTIVRRLAAADAAKGELDKKLRAIDDKDKSELEKAQRDLEEIKKRAERAEADALAAKLSSEILKFPGFIWHDPEAVLRMVDMEMISVDESGKVTGVKDALTKLARDKSYLLKGKQDGKDNKGSGNGGANGASGHNPGNGNDTQDANKRRAGLASKYKLR